MRVKEFLFVMIVLPLAFNLAAEKGKFFPDGLLITPFAANIFEPHLGFEFNTGKNTLELDISNSMDIYRFDGKSGSFSVGADLFTFTHLRREKNFHFPVDAVDYLFGLNYSYLRKGENFCWGFRSRFSHISAHFADGHLDNYTKSWHGGKAPIVYSREFVELTPFVSFNGFRFYFSTGFVYHIDPEDLGRDFYQIGFDFRSRRSFFIKNLTPFFGYDLRINHLKEYCANHYFKAGLKFGKPYGKGIVLFLSYYTGKNFHGEYYDTNYSAFAVGINLDI